MSNFNSEIHFIRHGQVETGYPSYAEMPAQELAKLAAQEINPGAKISFLKECHDQLKDRWAGLKFDNIFTSPQQRCLETSQYLEANILISKPKLVVVDQLREVKFDLLKIVKIEENGCFDLSKVNQAVLEAMVTGHGAESWQFVWQRLAQVWPLLTNNSLNLVVCHDYLLRVIEIFLKNKGRFNAKLGEGLSLTLHNNYLAGFKFVPGQGFSIIEGF